MRIFVSFHRTIELFPHSTYTCSLFLPFVGEFKVLRIQNRSIFPRPFSTSLQTIQTRTFSNSHLYTSVNQLRDSILDVYGLNNSKEGLEWSELSNPSQETMSAILGDSPALQGAHSKPIVLVLPPKDCQEYEECREMLLETQSSAAERVFAKRGRAALEKLAVSAIAVNDYKFLWKLLGYINKDRWNLFTPESYRLIIQALLNADHSSTAAISQLVDLFQHHIRTHPAFNSPDMQLLALYFVSSLASVQPVRALHFYKELSLQTAKLASHALDVALLELQLVSFLPYTDLLQKHVAKSCALTNQLGDADLKRKTANAIFFAFIQGLVTSEHIDDAASLLLSVPMEVLSDDVSLKLFVGAYKNVMEAMVTKRVTSVEKMLGVLLQLPETVRKEILVHERYEWLLTAHSNCDGKERMSDADAWATLECMSLVSGVTNRAVNAYLSIVAKNASKSTATDALKKKMEVLYDKFAFLGDAATFRLLAASSTSPSDVNDAFYRACISGQADASVYAVMFRKCFAENTEATNLSEFRLLGLLEQFERSRLSWTPALLFAVLSAISKHKLWSECWDLFTKLAASGEVRMDGKCANLAMASAQRLGGNHAALAGKLAKDMEMNLIRARQVQLSTTPNLTAAISSQSYTALNAPNSVLAQKVAVSLTKKEETSIDDIASVQPWMLLDQKTFNLICVKDGYQADLYMRLISEPFNLVPTAQTYLLMIRSCISNASWDELVKLLVAMADKHRTAVTDETIDDTLFALINANQLHLLTPLRSSLKPHGINLPDTDTLAKKFKRQNLSNL